MKKLTEKAKDKMIEEAYRKSCSGIAINIMDISKVFKAGHEAINNGLRDAELENAILTVTQSLSAKV